MLSIFSCEIKATESWQILFNNSRRLRDSFGPLLRSRTDILMTLRFISKKIVDYTLDPIPQISVGRTLTYFKFHFFSPFVIMLFDCTFFNLTSTFYPWNLNTEFLCVEPHFNARQYKILSQSLLIRQNHLINHWQI